VLVRSFSCPCRPLLLIQLSFPAALVQLFTIAASQNSNKTIFATVNQIQKFARPLGAIIVIFGLCVLVIGECSVQRLQPHLSLTHSFDRYRTFLRNPVRSRPRKVPGRPPSHRLHLLLSLSLDHRRLRYSGQRQEVKISYKEAM
jgi:hypothetical protein